MAGNEYLESQKVATVENLLAQPEEWLTSFNDIEKDVGIKKDAHSNLDTVFLSEMCYADIISCLAGSQGRHPGELPCPRASASSFSNRLRSGFNQRAQVEF